MRPIRVRGMVEQVYWNLIREMYYYHATSYMIPLLLYPHSLVIPCTLHLDPCSLLLVPSCTPLSLAHTDLIGGSCTISTRSSLTTRLYSSFINHVKYVSPPAFVLSLDPLPEPNSLESRVSLAVKGSRSHPLTREANDGYQRYPHDPGRPPSKTSHVSVIPIQWPLQKAIVTCMHTVPC